MLKSILWIVGIVVALAIIVPCLLYVPAVQEWAKNLVTKEVKKSSGLDISIDQLRLRFPLTLQVDGATVVEVSGDTMVSASALYIDVAPLPLLKGDVDVSRINAHQVAYNMGNSDSIMWLRARVDNFTLDGGDIHLIGPRIRVNKAMVDGADVCLLMRDSVTPTSTDSVPPSDLSVEARQIVLRNVRYRMSMLPVIDSLGAFVPSAQLRDGIIDLKRRTLHGHYLGVDSVEATYLTPSAQYLADHPLPVEPDTIAPMTDLWTITADSLWLTSRHAVYAMRDALPQPGFDVNYIEGTDIVIEVDSFYNCGPTIRVPVKRLEATERCGITASLTGTFSMDSVDNRLLMHASNFTLNTLFSQLNVNAMMGVGDMITDNTLPISLDGTGYIGMQDVRLMMPALKPVIAKLPRATDLELKALINGTTGYLNIDELSVEMSRYLRLAANGNIANVMDIDRMDGELKLNGWLHNLNSLKPSFLDARMAKEVNLPNTRLNGRIDYSPRRVDGRLTATTPRGHVALLADWLQKSEGYDIDLRLDSLAVDEFMPALGIGGITANATVKGHGYDIFAKRTAIDAAIDVASINIGGKPYRNIVLDASLADSKVTGALRSTNDNMNFDIDLSADILPDNGYSWDMTGKVANLDLHALQITDSVMHGSLNIVSSGTLYPQQSNINARLAITDLDWRMNSSRLEADSIKAGLIATDSSLIALVRSGDMGGYLRASCSLDTLLQRITETTAELDSQFINRSVDIRMLQSKLPPVDMAFRAGNNNLLASFLAPDRIGWRKVSAEFHNDSLFHFKASALGFRSADTRLDTINFEGMQHDKFLIYKGSVNNRPGTLDNFAHITANGYLADDKMSLLLRQTDINDKVGFLIGFNTLMTDSIFTLRLVPYTPTIGGKKWTVNNDNFISYNVFDHHIDANLSMSTDRSAIDIYTDHANESHNDSTASTQEDIILKLKNIQLSDWLAISPFAPPVKGSLGADMRIRWDEEQMTGDGTVNLTDLYYGRERVGSFDLGVDVRNTASGSLYADASLMVDSIKVITARGSVNDSTQVDPFNLDFTMIHLPLRIVNPFLPKDVARLSGELNGKMDITGTLANPEFNGYIYFDTTAVKVGMLGSSFAFSDVRIPVDSNVVHFNNFTIRGVNDSLLHVNGIVDARHITDVNYDLSLNANNFQIVNSQRARGAALVYGKANVDLNASVRGNLRYMLCNATLDVLPSTNVTYVLTASTSELTSQSTGDMVRFVNFADSASVAEADTIDTSTMALNLNAELNVQSGSVINVDLAALDIGGGGGNNKVSILGNGSLDYSMNPMNTEGRMTGRFNINGGYVRYTPPVLSEKMFSFIDGSYVAFTGDMLNPTLNIHAVDNLKANVTQEGQNSRLIDFEITVDVTNTLQNMNVAFNLSTNDDITVQNELASMSPDQRANQAMNLLLYNVYTGPSTKASSNLAANPLYTFLESQLNSWAANNIRGVDISFGIDQYNKTTDGTTSSAMSYSYKVSKTLFDNRVKIVVGGNYTTDANSDENFSENLINDISFEYMLTRSGNVYLRIFRHMGFESILEGEVTQTGVGFVLKRNINSLKDVFNFRGRR